ncbi:MAG: MmcQ/YjbR family DNA-binding protein [Chloroflexota bacterium]
MLTRDDLHAYCLQMTGAYEDFPFGVGVSVMKVKGKMFALLPVDEAPQTISLKCDPVEAAILRQNYEAIEAGYHLNKKHWNTVTMSDELEDKRIKEMIEDSYILVRQKLKKADRLELEKEENS